MPYYDFDPSLDFDAQEQQMLQAAARIKALRGMKLDTTIDQPEGFKSAVTGANFVAPTVKKPILSSLTPLVQDTVAGVQEKQLDQQRSTLSRQEQQAMQDWIKQTPQATQEKQLEVGAVGPELETVTKPPTREALLSHAMAGAANPAARPLSQAMLQDIMVHGPTREQQTKIELMKERQQALQKSLDRQTQLEAARIKSQGGGNYKPSGWQDPQGAIMYTEPGGRWFSLNYPVGSPGTESIPAGARRDPNFVGEGPRALPAGSGPAPTQMNQSAQDAVTAGGERVLALQDLQKRYNADKPTGMVARGSQFPVLNEIAQSDLVASVSPDTAKNAAYWSNFQEVANKQLLDISGKAVTDQEMRRQKLTMPTATTNSKQVNEWFDRQIKLTNIHVARLQALASNKNAYLDTKLNAVVDRTTGKVIKDTESPFSAEELKTTAPDMKVAPAEQAARDVKATATKQQELEQWEEKLAVAGTPEEKKTAQENVDALRKELGGKKPAAKNKKYNPATGRLE
jgi:hypothetical protein